MLSALRYARNCNLIRCMSNVTQQLNNKNKQVQKDIYCVIAGFSRFANREDLLEILGEVTPAKIEPMLDVSHYPTGRYLLHLNETSLAELRSHISKVHTSRFSVSIAGGPDNTAAEIGITNRSVRCRDVSKTLTSTNDVALIFENYCIADKGIQRVSNDLSTYIIHFASPEEAERATVERSKTLIAGKELQMFRYQC